jgi:hypothetical protein
MSERTSLAWGREAGDSVLDRRLLLERRLRVAAGRNQACGVHDVAGRLHGADHDATSSG